MNIIHNLITRFKDYWKKQHEDLENISRDCQFLSNFKRDYESGAVNHTQEDVRKYIKNNYEE